MENITIELAKEHLLQSNKVRIGSSLESCIERSEHYANDAINELIKHTFINWDFLHNGCDNKGEYKAIINNIIVPYISEHFNDYFEIVRSGLHNENVLQLKPSLYECNTIQVINNSFILKNGSEELKTQFYNFLKNRDIDLI